MTKPNPWLWPRHCWITVSNGRSRELTSSNSRRFDLADNVMLPWSKPQRTVRIGFSIDGGEAEPTEAEAARLLALIREDFGHDGYRVTARRLAPTGLDTYAWALRIRTV